MTSVTLQLDDNLVDFMKEYAAQHGKSLSSLVEDSVKNLIFQKNQPEPIKPFPVSTIEQGFGCVNYTGKTISIEEMEQGLENEFRKQWLES